MSIKERHDYLIICDLWSENLGTDILELDIFLSESSVLSVLKKLRRSKVFMRFITKYLGGYDAGFYPYLSPMNINPGLGLWLDSWKDNEDSLTSVNVFLLPKKKCKHFKWVCQEYCGGIDGSAPMNELEKLPSLEGYQAYEKDGEVCYYKKIQGGDVSYLIKVVSLR